MIRYRLACADGHEFDGWFKDSRAYDTQAKRGLVTCPDCGTRKVEKALMAPAVGVRQNKKDGAAKPRPSVPAAEPASEPMAMPANPEQRAMLEFMRRLRQEVTAKAEYVGPKFAEEARKIHYEETEARGIYGEATIAEAEALADEGISVLPLPILPEDRN